MNTNRLQQASTGNSSIYNNNNNNNNNNIKELPRGCSVDKTWQRYTFQKPLEIIQNFFIEVVVPTFRILLPIVMIIMSTCTTHQKKQEKFKVRKISLPFRLWISFL
uniref:Uncharacterized protein n=1 Tax=Glossina pallidipes TaxID=7398 RepID=A0A1A9ZYG4_GLOPL